MSGEGPRDGKFTRKGEKHGSKLSPGERAKHWCAAAASAWPVVLGLIGLLGYTNADEIRQFIKPQPVPTPEDVHAIGSFEDQVLQSLDDIVIKLKRHDEDIARLGKRDVTDNAGLQAQIDQLKAWHE